MPGSSRESTRAARRLPAATHRLRRLTGALALGAALGLGGCGLLPDQVDETEGWSAQRLFEAGKEAAAETNFEKAVEYFEKLKARYPFGRYSQQADLETAYAYYKFGEPDNAIAALDRFIRNHPRHPFVDYAYYLKGLANFDRADDFLNRLVPKDPAKTDNAAAQQSFLDFRELVTRFPDSRYARDARKRMLFLRNNLAAYEINVADFYLRRGAYLAAANRGKYVLENYASSPAVEQALNIMARAYIRLELPQLTRDTLRVLEENYPDSEDLPELMRRAGEIRAS